MAARSSDKTNGYPEVKPDEIVISGLSGRFPESNNVEEFKKHLLEGIDMVNDEPRRFPKGIYGIPERFGKLKNLSHFDAQYFGVHSKQADQLDPQIRLLLEVTYEAIIDAGFNPTELRGSNCGVFIGNCSNEALEYWEKYPEEINGYALLGCSRSMFANRLSYSFDFKGPSIAIDTACSSSLYAFCLAVKAIQSGECDSAIVGGANLTMKPHACCHFHRLGMLNPEGACKAFDCSANGYVRSEAVTALFLQRANASRRIYSTVLGAKTNSDGYKEMGITYPSGDMQQKLIHEVYEEVGIKPDQVNYIETHGTGTKVGDPQELNAVASFFCTKRKDPLPIGSVKSNMGHSEGASALCSIAKVVIAMETGIIPSNLHYNQPNPEIPSLMDGSLKVVNKNQPWNGGIVGINSFGFGGANAHVILRSNPKPQFKSKPQKLPRVIGVSGRTEEAVRKLLEACSKNKEDTEFLALIDQIHKSPITGHCFRGYTVLDNSGKSEITPTPSEKRPIWFVYPGMGSQWPAMGKDFMKIESFRKSIEKIAQVLKPRGIDIEDLLMNGTESTFDNIVNAYVAITAVQIALTDMIKMLKIEPDGIIGHSFGEVGCGYADGCLTAEQAILCTLERGLAVIASNSPPGSMASVGLTWKEAKERCPPLVYTACHNTDTNVTISGDLKEMKKFMSALVSEDVFVREVKSAGFAFHCRHIAKAAPLLEKSLKTVIPNPKTRSSRWISTSVPQSSWDKPESKLCSPSYYVNNLLSPVLFREGLRHIPKNALLIEIAPNGTFQSLLKKSIGSECAPVNLAKRDHDNVNMFLSGIGKIYSAGAHPCFSALYGSTDFPVGRGTPMISPHIKWDHSTEWAVANFVDQEQQSGEFLIEIDMTKEKNQYLLGHKIDGRFIYPGAGYLVLVWQVFAKIKNQEYENLPVIFEDVHLYRPTLLSNEETVKFYINIFTSSGAFELREGGSLVTSGKIRSPDDVKKETIDMSKYQISVNEKELPLSMDDIYKDLLLRGYEYSDIFKGIIGCDNEGNRGKILWRNNWISFLDTVLQFTMIGVDKRDLLLPTKFQKVIIDPVAHKRYLQSSDELLVEYNKDLELTKCGGIETRCTKASLAHKRPSNRHPKLEKYQFIPYIANNGNPKMKLTDILTIFSQILLENSSRGRKLKMNEVILDGQIESSLSPILKQIFKLEPLTNLDVSVVSTKPLDPMFFEEHKMKNTRTLEEKLDFAVCHDLLIQNDFDALKTISKAIIRNGFIILEESEIGVNISDLMNLGFHLISRHNTSEKSYLLLRKQSAEYSDQLIIPISCTNYSWVEKLKNELRDIEEKSTIIYLYSDDRKSGIVGLVNSLAKEIDGNYVRYIFVQDKISKPFSIDNYSDQLKKGLVHNVLKDGVWGSYRHLLLEDNQKSSVAHAIINTMTRGDLSSLRWIQSPLSAFRSNSADQDLCHVYYASLNFRDIMLATGKLPPDALPADVASQDNILGMEFSGRNLKGERIMGLVECRSLGTTVLLDPFFTWKVPRKWSLEEAATIPVVYCTAYYSLIMRGRLKPGESVLIHAGSGGVGIAAITIALTMGCTVFTTVGSKPKREFLKNRFPDLSDENIGYSRDTSFEQFLLTATKGKGVDVILNSLASEQLYASLRCLARNGRFLEIGKVDLSNDSPLGMNIFLKNISFHAILVDALFASLRTNDDKIELVAILQDGINNGTIKPLPASVFNEEEVEEAFRFLATGKHIGKVIIKIREQEPQEIVIPKPKIVPAIPRSYMYSHKSYILVGGLGGLGLELADWLIRRGATRIIISSRTGIKTGYQSLCMRRWREKKIKVVISTEDVTTEIGARRLIEQAKCLGPVGGIFNLAAVIKDRLIENQSEETFEICCKPKVDATMHLDKISRGTLKELDYFVTFSSYASGRGNSGQSNYSFANSVLDRICEERCECGYPGLSIQWGAIGDVGMAMILLGGNDDVVLGTLPQRIPSFLSIMDIFLQQRNPIVSSFVLADNSGPSNADNKVKLVETVANILGLKEKNNHPKDMTFTDLGMDSLMSAEIKHTLERNFDIILSSAEIRVLTFDKLMEYEENIKSENDSVDKTNSEKPQLDFRNIEMMPTKTIVKMTKSDKFHNRKPLFLIHPMEGNIQSLVGMAVQIDAPVYGLQCTADAPLDSIENLAKYYLEHIRTIQPSGPYVIAGYSYGACVAFEIGIQLEKDRQEVKLWLIDGSPLFVTIHLLRERTNKSVEANSDQEETEALLFFMKQVSDIDETSIASKLMKLSSWEEKLSLSMKILAEKTSITESELVKAATSFVNKIKAADKYIPSKKFQGKVGLLKATESHLKLDYDYGLSEICESSVNIETVEGNHTSILIGSSAEKLAKILQPC